MQIAWRYLQHSSCEEKYNGPRKNSCNVCLQESKTIKELTLEINISVCLFFYAKNFLLLRMFKIYFLTSLLNKFCQKVYVRVA